MTTDRLLFWLVRVNAGVLLLAAPCALLPFAWMEAIHREKLGLGSLPDVAITQYMARSLSLAYALHGAVILGVTFDWTRYRPLVPLLARLHIAFGFAMICVDLSTGMPWWWAVSEGPTIVGFAILILTVNRRVARSVL
jgi:hypothetical protein